MSSTEFLARYRLDSVVHRGTLGTLYLAEQVALKRIVLVRVIAKEIADDPMRRRRLVEQIERLSRADDKVLVPILDLGEVDGQPFYALERLDGLDLKSASHWDSHFVGDGATPADLEVRTRELREFLQACRKLGGALLQIGDLRPAEVLLVKPFRFVLAEPCLAAGCAPAGARISMLRETIETAFAIALDPTLDARERAAGRESAMALRSSVFQELSSAEDLDPDRLLEAAIAAIARSGGHPSDRSPAAEVLVRPAPSGHWWRLPKRHVYRATVVGMLAIGAAAMIAAGMQDAASKADREAHRAFAAGRRAGDLRSLDALAHGSTSVAAAVRDAARAEADRLLQSVLDRAVDAAVGRVLEGRAVDLLAVMPTDVPPGCEPTFRSRLAEALRGLDERARTVRAVFEADLDKGQDALLELVARDAPEVLKRCVVLRLLTGSSRPMARCAAVTLASGVVGHPADLDERLGALLLDPEVDPALGLALVGWFANLPDERGVPILRRVSRHQRERARAQSPNKDPFAVRLYRAVRQTDDVLAHWIGTGFSEGRSARSGESRPLAVRDAALFALEKLDPDHALALLAEAIRDMDGLGKALLMVVSRQATRVSTAQLGELLRAAVRNGDDELIRSLIRAVAGRDAALARSIVVAELRTRRTPNEAALVTAVVEEGLVADPDALVAMLAEFPIESLQHLAPFVDRSRDLGRILQQLTGKALPELDRARVALLRTKCGLALDADVDELVARVADRRSPPALRVSALEALAGTGDARAHRCLRTVIVDGAYPRELRVLALTLAPRILGTRRTSYLTSRVAATNSTDLAAILDSMTRAVGDPDAAVRDLAASTLVDYESPAVFQLFRSKIARETPVSLLEIATGYVAGVRIDPVDEELDRVMLDLLEDQDVPESVKTNVLNYFTTNERAACLPTVIEVLREFEGEDTALAALQYIGTRISDPGVAEALLDFVQSDQTLRLRLHALELVAKRIAAGHGPDPAALGSLLSATVDAEVVFGCSDILLRAGAVPPAVVLVDAFRRHVVRVAAADARSSDARLTRSLDFGTPRILLEIREDGFDDLLVATVVDHELEGDALASAAVLLIQRLAKSRRDAAPLERMLQARNLKVAGLVDMLMGRAFAGAATDGAVDWARQLLPVLDFLCDYCRPRREPAPFLARARYRLQEWRDYVDVPSEGGGGRELLVAQCIEDLRWAVNFAGADEHDVPLELFAAQQEVGDDAGALETLEAHHARRPGDVAVAFLTVDHLVSMGRVAEARARIDQIGQRDVEYWRRRIDLEVAAGAEPQWIANLLEEPRWRDPKLLLGIAPRLLSALHDRRDDPACAKVRRELAVRMARILRTDFGWRNRALAAFHLSWLAPQEYADELALAGRTDTDPTVRRDGLWGLFTAQPSVAVEIAREQLVTGDAMLRPMAYWLLAQAKAPARLDHLRWGLLDHRSNWRREAIGIAVAYDEAEVIAQVTALLDHEDAEVRRLAATALGVFGVRGHAVDAALLRQCFLHEVDPDVAFASGQALGLVGDAEILERCRIEIRDFVNRAGASGAAARFLPLRLGMLGAHQSPAALALIERVIAFRRQGPDVDIVASDARIARFVRDRDDESLGDVADSLVAMGDFARARRLYLMAADFDPGDSEWTSKLRDLQLGRIPEGVHIAGGDPILAAALAAKSMHVERQHPLALALRSVGPRVGPRVGLREPLTALLARAIAPATSQDVDPRLDPASAGQRLESALDVLRSWPHFALPQANPSAPAGPELGVAAVAEVLDSFGGRLPAVLADAVDLQANLVELHAMLTGSSLDRSRILPLGRLADEVRAAWSSRRR